MENAQNFGADDNTFSSAFAVIYLEEPINLQQVDSSNIIDHDLNNFNQEFPTNKEQSFIDLLGPPPVSPIADADAAHNVDELELASDKIDEIKSKQFAPKTKKQTNWGVRKFRGKPLGH